MTYFNSNMVWLKDIQEENVAENILKFQFQYGLIKRIESNLRKRKRKKFQFQYGLIKRKFNGVRKLVSLPFQFQYGLIKRKSKLLWPEGFTKNFNSNMVWLKAIFLLNLIQKTQMISIPIWFD